MEFEFKLIEALDVYEVTAFGFQAQLRKVINESGTHYTVLFPYPVIAVNKGELRKYIMFLEYLEFFVQELNDLEN